MAKKHKIKVTEIKKNIKVTEIKKESLELTLSHEDPKELEEIRKSHPITKPLPDQIVSTPRERTRTNSSTTDEFEAGRTLGYQTRTTSPEYATQRRSPTLNPANTTPRALRRQQNVVPTETNALQRENFGDEKRLQYYEETKKEDTKKRKQPWEG